MVNLQSLGPKNLQALFANIEQILAVNTDFLVQILQIEDLKNISAYAEVFLTMVNLLILILRANDSCATFHIAVINKLPAISS